MTQEEFRNLINEDLHKLSEEEFLKHLIRFTEERYIWYKTQIESLHKDKETWIPGDEFTVWYKEFLRENKNREESDLKELQIEMTHCKQGMNPPFCYPAYKRKASGDSLAGVIRNKKEADDFMRQLNALK
jgi:hypothetical protein